MNEIILQLKLHKNNCYIKKIFLLGFFLITFSACTSVVRFNNNATPTQNVTNNTSITDSANIYNGLASYYNDKFDGRKTANGEIFSQKELTAAHRTLPFGTIVKVTRISNQKQVVVRINDRGPFADNRIIDLSYRAAVELDLINVGVAEVIIEVIKQ
jgi:rare lipoprotein A